MSGLVLSQPLVSVIIPVFNREEWIVDCVQSVVDQTYTNLEIIVVDDGSTDRTESSLMAGFSDQIVFLKQVNAGQAAATNRGLVRAKGIYVALLDSDDIWLKDKIEKQVSYLESHPDVVALYTDAEQFVRLGINHRSYFSIHPKIRNTKRLMEAMVDCQVPLRSTLMLRRDFLDAFEIDFYTGASGKDDIGILMEILGYGGRIDLLGDVTVYRRMHGSNMSTDHYRRFSRRIDLYRHLIDKHDGRPRHWRRALSRALADAEFRVGESHWGRGEFSQARGHFVNSTRAFPLEFRSWLGLAYTAIPSRLVSRLRRFKRELARPRDS